MIVKNPCRLLPLQKKFFPLSIMWSKYNGRKFEKQTNMYLFIYIKLMYFLLQNVKLHCQLFMVTQA